MTGKAMQQRRASAIETQAAASARDGASAAGMVHPQAMALVGPHGMALHQLAARLDQAPPLARLRTVQRALNGGVVQAMMEGEPVVDAPPNAPGFVAQDIPPAHGMAGAPVAAAPPNAAGFAAQGIPPAHGMAGAPVVAAPPNAPGFVAQDIRPGRHHEAPAGLAHEDIAFSTRQGGAGGAAAAAARSIYFNSGHRIRLQHDEGPHVEPYRMDRYTFLPQPGGGGDYDTDDYHGLAHGESFAHMAIPAAAGDPGLLFETGHGGVTHVSRGSPVSEQGVQDQAHLDRIFSVAKAADAELEPLRRAYYQTMALYQPLRAARIAAETAVTDATARRDAAAANPATAAAEQQRLDADVVRHRAAYDQAVALALQPRALFMTAQQTLDARATHHNAAMHVAYTGGAAAAAGGGAGAAASTATAAAGSAAAAPNAVAAQAPAAAPSAAVLSATTQSAPPGPPTQE